MDNFYYKETIRSVTTKFMSIFDNMTVKKYTAPGGSIVDSKTVPIRWGPIDKYYDIRNENYNADSDPYYMQLPRMAVKGPILSYATNRVSSAKQLRDNYNESLDIQDVDSFFQDLQPVPYDFRYELHIRSDSMERWCQIIENILPYFNPTLALRVREFDGLNIERDLVVRFEGDVSPEFTDPQEESNRREVKSVLSFVVEGYMYGSTSATTNMIKYIESSYYFDTQTTDFTSAYKVDQFNTSGYQVSAQAELSGENIPNYLFSGYSSANDVYYFTSATSAEGDL